uniref:SH3 domain-containing protein n=1 Tax=Toxocara canis TaxID=6265 RepID=A0A183V9W4_TOXCA
LFDYSHHMSPNANAQQEELSFRKHQLIKVFGEVDQDGFYTGQIGHRVGLVPSNMVIEIAKDDLLPQRRRSDALPEPSLRRMRWGSLKSRSYDHAGDRRPPHYRPAIEHEYYASSLERRDHSLPTRPTDYFTSATPSRRVLDARAEAASAAVPSRGEAGLQRSEYMTRGDHDEQPPYDAYPPNGRHGRDYYAYSRDYRSREPQERERDRREYYRDERDMRDVDVRDGRELREHRDVRETREQRDAREMRDREMRGDQRDLRERDYGREMRGDTREARYAREPSSSRRERDYMEDREEQRSRDYREARDYREPREVRDAEYREMRKERERDAEQMGKQYDERGYAGGREVAGQRGYDRRDYGRLEKTQQEQYHDTAQYGTAAPQRYPAEVPPTEDTRYGRTNGESLPVRKMIAKFDYDSRQLSPNVDAEQVELSFHAGDVITVFGEMDEDGFYMGELNGLRGLVPSNFLQTSPPSSLMPSQMPSMQPQVQQPSQPIPPITVAVPDQPRAKGVAFQETAKKGMPARQTSQTSASTKAPVAGKGTPKTGSVNAQKALTKKGSDVGSKGAPNARKTSQAAKKTDGATKLDYEVKKIDFPQISIPITGGPGTGVVNVTNLRIQQFTSPDIKFKLAPPNGIGWKTQGGSVKVVGNWQAEYTVVIPISISGYVKASAVDIRMVLQADIDVDDLRPQLNVDACSMDVQSVDVAIGGGILPWIVNLFRPQLSALIKEEIRTQVQLYAFLEEFWCMRWHIQ